MKNAIGYARISTTDQSNFSISGQQEYIVTHCQRSDINLLDIFTDGGQSAKNFDRANWKELQVYIKKNFKNVDYLIVSKYDRFSRNVAEALKMIDDLEKKYNIKVISVMEPIALHPDSPYYFQFRTQMLLGADVELRVIRDRTRFGMVSAAKNGRYVSSAPVGYKNERDAQNKPIITVFEPKADLIREVFNLYLSGMPLAEIKQTMKAPLNLKGNSAIRRILTNHVYAGLIRVPSYYDEPEKFVKGIHEGIISENDFYRVQNMLNNKVQVHTIYNEEVPLRGVVKCHCGKMLTAGNSKGKSKHYWYYKCPEHLHNLSGNRMHSQIVEILESLKLLPDYIQRLKSKVQNNLKSKQKEAINTKASKILDLKRVEERIESLQLKYISGDFDVVEYKKWQAKLKTEKSAIEQTISSLQVADTTLLDFVFSKISSLSELYQSANIFRKQSLLKILFGENLCYENGVYRTPYIMPLFIHKSLVLKEKRLLELQETALFSGLTPASAPYGISIELKKLAEWLKAA